MLIDAVLLNYSEGGSVHNSKRKNNLAFWKSGEE